LESEQLEASGGWFHSLSRSRGWILAGSSLGTDAWIPVNTVDRDEPTSYGSNAASTAGGNSRFGGINTLSGGGPNAPATAQPVSRAEEKKEHFPGSGQTLGAAASSAMSRENLQNKRLAALGVSNV
jgi:hypothetical protein